MKKSKADKTKTEKKKMRSFVWLLGVSFMAVGLLFFCQFYFGDSINDKTTFYQNTHINGVDVSGMTKQEAMNVVSSKMLDRRDDIQLTLTADSREWTLKSGDFEVSANIEEPIKQVMAYGRSGNIFDKKKVEKRIKDEGLDVNISYKNVLGGIDNKIDEIISDVESDGGVKVKFNPDAQQMFTIDEECAVKVDRSELENRIDSALQKDVVAKIEIPLTKIVPDVDKEELINRIKLRSSFSTDYSTSSNDRKSNIKKALSCFNGMIVEPGQEVSFNHTTGPRTVENGYKKANIIVGGVYIAGAGGGVCQASTTLYNALLRAGIDIVQVNHHSLPASYVPLSFDAMVSEGFSDLVFQNNLDSPIYIKAYGDDKKAYVEIFGQEFEPGEEIKTRVEFVRIIPHSGDKIVGDEKGEYSKYVIYKGEYYRLKYPREGYESKGYIQYIKDGKVVDEKLIRHDFYMPQSGVIVEGQETLGAGMSLPPSDVKIIPAQKVTDEKEEVIKKKIEKLNPSEFQP